ncbi:HAD family hydrolase [Corallococcus exiguus]|uniref:HAD family hydrolase n=1 Tax=Corallococcus exiguus TaxID=83462 RepID=A0A7X4Y4W2_9BACT|nr:HAD family hydrolase [Corallococcus exiguus]NBC38194.1 HAD family hydrolase [Corallococcus exiguus]TNV67360.1 HAD family hydrolase [Corallococcus exiguus]
MIKLIVTDMDGTLYSWVDYIVPSVEALVGSVMLSTGWPRIRIVQALKRVYAQNESNEYPFALQESEIFDAFPEFDSFDKLVIEPARAAFAQARRKYLQLFPGVLDTLQTLKMKGLPVVALTDAPRNPVEVRAKLLKIDGLLDAIYCLPGFTFPEHSDGRLKVSRMIAAKEQRGEYRAACRVVELPRDYEKPNPAGLLRICAEMKVEPKEVLVIGDAAKKDVAVARKVGSIDCWAEYGTYISQEYRERLEIVSAPAITQRHAASVHDAAARAHAPETTHRLSNFNQLLEILELHGS